MKFITTHLTKFTSVVLILFFLPKAAFTQQANSKPFILGVIDEIQSTALAEKRILNIYLPEGYNKADTTRYPVVYLLDGSADEDFIHISGLFQFNSFPWINRVPKSIIVGIANVDRKRDFTYPTTVETDRKKLPTTGHSAKFITFLEKELQPFIEKNYKANASKMLIGQSLAGLLAAEVLVKKPALFNKYVIISPSLWWDKGSLLKQSSEILKEEYSPRTDIYIGVGKEGLVSPVAAPGDTPHVMEVDANVFADQLKHGKSKNVHVYFDYLPQENHGTITHQAVFNALRLLYPLPKTDQE
jgi:predicted alpha/beta superfamily hydrolase